MVLHITKRPAKRRKKIAGKAVIGVNKVGPVNYINFINPSTISRLTIEYLN